MHDQVDKWLAGDWMFLGMHVPHWLIAIAAISLAALLVTWFERPRRAGDPEASEPREHSARPQYP